MQQPGDKSPILLFRLLFVFMNLWWALKLRCPGVQEYVCFFFRRLFLVILQTGFESKSSTLEIYSAVFIAAVVFPLSSGKSMISLLVVMLWGRTLLFFFLGLALPRCVGQQFFGDIYISTGSRRRVIVRVYSNVLLGIFLGSLAKFKPLAASTYICGVVHDDSACPKLVSQSAISFLIFLFCFIFASSSLAKEFFVVIRSTKLTSQFDASCRWI